MRFELLGIFLSLTLLISGFGYGVNYADAVGPTEPCNYLDRHHYLKISYDGSKYPGVAYCEKVDYWVPEKCGNIAGLYKTDNDCQPPPVLVSEPAPASASAPAPASATAAGTTPDSRISGGDLAVLFVIVIIIVAVLSLISKRKQLGRKRIRKRKGTKERQQISGDVRHTVYLRDNYRCRICGKGDEDYDLQIDHIKPVSKGGTNDMSNLQTLCEDCNKEKGNKWKGKGHSYRD